MDRPLAILRNCVVAVCGLVGVLGYAAPLRVMLPPLTVMRSSSPEEIAVAGMGLYLRERLTECPGIALVSDDRGGALYFEMTSGIRTVPAEGMLAAYQEYLPLDAVIDYTARDGVLSLTIAVNDALMQRTMPLTGKDNLVSVIRQGAQHIGTALKLSPAEQASLTRERIGNP